jgi:membrane-associated HD superfamily phosphohydrolase
MKIKLPSSKLARILFFLIISTIALWLLNTDANNCLDRDFSTQPSPALCWRQTNDYESTLAYIGTFLLISFVLTIIFSALIITKYLIKKSAATPLENKKTAIFLTSLSIVLLIFILTVMKIWLSTEFNNNNYALNNAATLVFTIGAPAWIAVTTSAVAYTLNSKHIRRKK